MRLPSGEIVERDAKTVEGNDAKRVKKQRDAEKAEAEEWEWIDKAFACLDAKDKKAAERQAIEAALTAEENAALFAARQTAEIDNEAKIETRQKVRGQDRDDAALFAAVAKAKSEIEAKIFLKPMIEP